MKKYHFTNFEDIDKELEVLELQKELQFLKLKGSIISFREQLTVSNLFKQAVSSIGEKIKASTSLKEMIFRFLWNKVKPEETTEEA
jgi:hypothetical protein